VTGNYIHIDKKRTMSAENVVAVIQKRGKAQKSEVVTTSGNFFSKTSARKLIERLEGGKKTKNTKIRTSR